tara:strand:+ start:7567 stop:8676 length:1110 start_codon:yes stop_codon:yes gene_type:complete
MSLDSQIESKRKEIFTDSYPMSIGELANLYIDGDLEINPKFQRNFRWTNNQKVKLIESILLGIPIPSIFVAQRDDGVWELVDGLQRLSTIFSFMGVLKNTGEKLKNEPLILKKTEYLSDLEKVSWKGDNSLSDILKRTFKRAKIDIKIVNKESDHQTKFELFQRLNTGGSNLSDQEVRNCLLIMLDESVYERIQTLSEYPPFCDTICITERAKEQKYDMELTLRLLCLAKSTDDDLKGIDEVSEFITQKFISICDQASLDWNKIEAVFKKTFDIINDSTSENTFRRKKGDEYKGAFQLSIYELIATGVFLYLENDKPEEELPSLIEHVSELLSSHDEFQRYSGSGQRANHRLPKIVKICRELFLNEDQK